VSSSRVSYASRPDSTPEAELSALAAIYEFALLKSQAKRGGPHDLTSDSPKKRTTRQDKRGRENADLHSN
jgi:hypothetical protein